MEAIINEIKRIMTKFYDECTDMDGVYRAMAGPLGITGAYGILDVLIEPGFNLKAPYPIVHFLVTLAKNVPDEYADEIKRSLQDLNLVISTGGYPSFGCFCYEPNLKQIYLNYRLPINPDSPESDLPNLRYYFGSLHEHLDRFADFIMFMCDNNGSFPSLSEYLRYLDSVNNFTDYEERIEKLKENISELEKYGFKE